MKKLNETLTSFDINLSSMLLDPNNPRFSELGEHLYVVPETRYDEDKVQKTALERMKNPIFDVSELKDTIKSVGFLQMDRIVVRKWNGLLNSGTQKYVVIEGNRRVTALKWLIDLHESGKETLDEAQLKNFTEINCLLLDENAVTNVNLLILPGLRHVSGIKEWGPYQKAKTIHALRKSGLSPLEAAQSLGLSTIAANRAYRCFLALESMKSSEEYGEYAVPKMYSYFEEVLKRPEVKKWLNWSDDTGSFQNETELFQFYSWMIPNEEDGDESGPRLPEAKSVRELAKIINNEQAFAIFSSDGGSLTRALVSYESEHPQDWYPKILSALSAVKALTPTMLREMDDSASNKLSELTKCIESALQDKELLTTRV
jgi:ParB-like nuclease domain